MKCQAEVEARQKCKKISMKECKQDAFDELESNSPMREMWCKTMNLRRDFPGKRHKLPNMSSMSKVKETTAVGAAARNKYVLPTVDWSPEYGSPLPLKLALKRFTTGELVEHVVFHSENPPNHLMDLQDFKSNQMTTTTYMDATELSQKQEESNVTADALSTSRLDCPDKSAAENDNCRPFASSFQPSQSDSGEYTRQFLRDPRNRPHPRTMENPQTPGCSSDRRNAIVKREESDDQRTPVCRALEEFDVKMEPGAD